MASIRSASVGWRTSAWMILSFAGPWRFTPTWAIAVTPQSAADTRSEQDWRRYSPRLRLAISSFSFREGLSRLRGTLGSVARQAAGGCFDFAERFSGPYFRFKVRLTRPMACRLSTRLDFIDADDEEPCAGNEERE